MGKTTTSLKIDEKIYKDFKKKCIDLDLDFSDGFDQALVLWSNKKW